MTSLRPSEQLAQARLSGVSARSQLFLEAVDLEFVTGNLLRPIATRYDDESRPRPQRLRLRLHLSSFHLGSLHLPLPFLSRTVSNDEQKPVIFSRHRCCLPPVRGCGRAPAIDVIGSFFPAWMVCLIISIVLASVLRCFFCAVSLSRPLSRSRSFTPASFFSSAACCGSSSSAKESIMDTVTEDRESQTNRSPGRHRRRRRRCGFAPVGRSIMIDHSPRTDDASVWANYIEIAPEVSGRLVRASHQRQYLCEEGRPALRHRPSARTSTPCSRRCRTSGRSKSRSSIERRRIAAQNSAVRGCRRCGLDLKDRHPDRQEAISKRRARPLPVPRPPWPPQRRSSSSQTNDYIASSRCCRSNT